MPHTVHVLNDHDDSLLNVQRVVQEHESENLVSLNTKSNQGLTS